MTRICTTTGLALDPGPAVGVRVSNPAYGVANPVVRKAGEDRASWSRWDTRGRTIYIASDAATAFRECLAWARMTPDHHARLQKFATLWGITPDEVAVEIANDFRRNGNMQPGHLPAGWRDGHLLYNLEVTGPQWWVDATKTETFTALTMALGEDLQPLLGRSDIDHSVVMDDNRLATTTMAEWLRIQVLDDGSEPAGIRFTSRHGGGICWAYWMRRTDAGLTNEPITADAGNEIPLTSTPFNVALTQFHIKSF